MLINPFAAITDKRQLRLIPEIEKNERLKAFVATANGKWFITALFILVLYTFESSFFAFRWQLVAVAILFGLCPLRMTVKIALGGLLMLSRGLPWGFGSAVTKADQFDYVQQAYTSFMELMGINKSLHYLAAVFASLAIGFLAFRFLKLIKTRIAAVWLFFIWCGLLSLALHTQSISIAFNSIWLTMGICSITLFSLAYFYSAHSNSSIASGLGFNLQAFFAMPPFTLIRHPSLIEKEPHSPEVIRLKALKLLIWSRILSFAHKSLLVLFYDKLGLENFNWLGLAEFNAHGMPWYAVFSVRFGQTLILLLFLSVNTGIAISFFRLAGVYLPRAVCRPYLARSFNDYYRRVLFYYSEMIVHLFFYPLYEKAYFLINRRSYRVQLALFLSLFAGGWIFHVVIMWQNFFFFGWEKSALNALGWLPYFAAVAICCCVSQAGWIHTKLRSAPMMVHFLLNLTLHSLLMTFMQYSIGESFGDRFNFLRSMMPF